MDQVMHIFIGQKIVGARPLCLGEYNDMRGWNLPENESPETEGYLIEYDGSPSNLDGYQGYISWTPKDVFEEAYVSIDEMGFDGALKMLELGKRVARQGWNGKAMFIFLVPGSEFSVNRVPLLGIYDKGTPIKYQPHIDMKTADDSIVPWLASQTDLLSKDWGLVE